MTGLTREALVTGLAVKAMVTGLTVEAVAESRTRWRVGIQSLAKSISTGIRDPGSSTNWTLRGDNASTLLRAPWVRLRSCLHQLSLAFINFFLFSCSTAIFMGLPGYRSVLQTNRRNVRFEMWMNVRPCSERSMTNLYRDSISVHCLESGLR